MLGGDDQLKWADVALGLFDPTILRDGSYAITLSATDLGNNTASDTEIVDVKSDIKLGNFSLSFTDLEIPVAEEFKRCHRIQKVPPTNCLMS